MSINVKIYTIILYILLYISKVMYTIVNIIDDILIVLTIKKGWKYPKIILLFKDSNKGVNNENG